MCEIKQFPKTEETGNRFSVTMDDNYTSQVRKMAVNEFRTLSQQIFHLVKLGLKYGKTDEGEYQITLNLSELEAIRYALGACNEFMYYFKYIGIVKTSVDFGFLEDRVFSQYVDGNGNPR